MKKILKIMTISFGAVFALCAAIAGTYLVVTSLESHQDFKTIDHAFKNTNELSQFKGETPEHEYIICRPQNSKATTCPSYIFAVDKTRCLQIIKDLTGSSKEHCSASKAISSQGRDIVIRFGQLYERANGEYYLQIILNEPRMFDFF